MNTLTLTLKLEDFPTFISLLRTNVSDFPSLLDNFKDFGALNECFNHVQQACCSRRMEINRACSVGFRAFVFQSEKNQAFFLTVKEKLKYEKISFTENEKELISY